MKHVYKLIFAVFSVSVLSVSTYSTKEVAFQKAFKNSHFRFTGGAQPAKTGAPGEANCTQCHSGSVQAGAGINMVTLIDNATQMPVTSYIPGSTYSVTITTDAATKRGFQLSARVVDGNTQAGIAVGVAGVSSVQSSGGQQYVNHTAASTLITAGWVFTWTAPATDVGDITFYLATNITNNSSTNAGDVIRLSEHTFSTDMVTSLDEKNSDVVIVYPNPTNDNVTVKNINLANFKQIELVDFNGKTLQKWTISSTDMNLTLKNIQAGSYFLKLKGNKELKKAIIIQ